MQLHYVRETQALVEIKLIHMPGVIIVSLERLQKRMVSQRDRDIDRNRCSDAWYERSRIIDNRLSND